MNHRQANELAMMRVVEQFLLENTDVVSSSLELREAVEAFRAALQRLESFTPIEAEEGHSQEVSDALHLLENRLDPLVKPMAYGEKKLFASGYKIARIVVRRDLFVDPELPQADAK